MDLQKIIMGVLGKTLNKPDGEIAELIKEADGKTEETIIKELLALDATRISSLREANKQNDFQDGYKKSKKETMELFEKAIKDKYVFESDKTGADLIDAIIADKGKAPEAGAMTPDDIMRTPTYQELLKAKADTEKAHKEEIKTLNANHAKEKAGQIIGDKAMKTLATFNPILSEVPEIALNLQNLFIKSLSDKYVFGENDSILSATDGKLVIDDHGNARKWEDIVKSEAGSFYQFKANNGGGNAGNDGGNAGAGAGGNSGAYPAGIQKPKTLEELSKIVNDESISVEDRLTVTEVYNKENGER